MHSTASTVSSARRHASYVILSSVHHCRYEDNFDAVNNVAVIQQPSDKGDIGGYGSPDKFLESVQYLFGKQTFTGDDWVRDQS